MNTLQELKQRVSTEPFNLSYHDELIDVLRLNRKLECQALFSARLNKHKYFLIDQTDINAIIEELLTIEDSTLRNQLLDEFYDYLLKELPTVEFWLKYLEFCLKTKDIDDIQITFIKALNDTVHDFAHSNLIWEKVLAFFAQMYEKSGDEDDLERLWKLYIKRISFPHKTLDESFSETSKFVTNHFQDNYDQYMSAAQKIYSDTNKKQEYYQIHEWNINKDPTNGLLWSNYITEISRYATSPKQVSIIFYRSLLSGDNSWVSVWITYIYNLYTTGNDVTEVLPKFVKAFPNSCISYAEMIRNISLFPQEYELLRERIEYLDLMRQNSYDDWKVLALAILSHGKSSDNIHKDIETFFTFAIEENMDIFHSVEKLTISILEFRDEIQLAVQYLKRLLNKFIDSTELWVFTFEFYKRHGFPYEDISQLFEWAVESANVLDWPERLIQEQLGYEQVYGTPESYRKALVKADKTIRTILENKVEEESKKRPLEDDFQPNKRTKVEPTRNREQLKVKVTGLTSKITEKKLVNFFKDCGDINDIIIFTKDDEYQSVIEFDSEQAVFAALTKTFKAIDESKVTVKRLMNCIIWTTNFPPSMDESKLKELFQQCGKILSVRFPIQTTKKVRRFCYVEFDEPESAQVALHLNGKQLTDDLDGKTYKLIVKLSDTDSKDKKQNIAKREIHISNVDFKVNEDKIKQFFEQFGTIESITLPLTQEMRSKGFNNGGYGFIVFKSETSATEALQFDGKKFENRTINIKPSKKLNTDVDLRSFDEEKSVVVVGIDNTTTKEQIQLFIKEKVTLPEKILQFPDHQAVIVQFSSIADSGKASLKLETESFKGKKLEIITKRQLQSKIQNKTQPKVKGYFIPPSIRRKR
ncbi:hypothetical protein CLIB1444_11S02520 [[Candida] jaroonii]|uniref:Uncharacterized protein n=1 Tax=[Candida] jaroonii TaxID=467808 RepID=A0ACA9YCS7_9ASCO|nr:hypothetical protein CLIB1444_11S02520 [[Candida] jaroonii]